MLGATAMLSTVSRAKEMRDVPGRMADRLIVALDVPSPEQAEKIVRQLESYGRILVTP
jgi:orotidine-5'-phosphate decarboxylase